MLGRAAYGQGDKCNVPEVVWVSIHLNDSTLYAFPVYGCSCLSDVTHLQDTDHITILC